MRLQHSGVRIPRWVFALCLLSCGTTSQESGSTSPRPQGPEDGGQEFESGNGVPVASSPDASSTSASCVTAAQLRTWQQQIDLFDGGNRPTGSPAHEGYIHLLAQQLTGLGLSDVHTEPYTFVKWTPSSFALKVAGTPVAVSAVVPYSGSTGPGGVSAPLAYVPGFTIPMDAGNFVGAVQHPTTWMQNIVSAIEATLEARLGALLGRIVVFDLPLLAVTFRTLTGTTLALNDPGQTIAMDRTVTRPDLSAMLLMPAMLNALALAGAVGAVAILDAPEEAARGEYAPFFGPLSPNMPSLYVDRVTGAALKGTLASPGMPPTGTLVLDATLAPATSENLVGVLPGASSEEILVGSHTDGPNSIEDNGPVGILGLAQCLVPLPASQRPRTIRVVLSGGHFAASVGLMSYVAAHTGDLAAHALAVLELEHLGALEWAEVSPGVMGLTGRPETQVVYTSTNAPLVAASKVFASQFPRTVVGTPPILGEGQNFRIVPLVQFITLPEYLLLSNVPVTQQFTDFDLMQRQVLAFLALEQTVAVVPASQLGVP
jgi:hypothetical protein